MTPDASPAAAAVAVLILMGVSGAGKTTVGRLLAAELGWPFYEGDDYHPPANVAKMGQGLPLTDADRAPWLERLRELVAGKLAAGRPAILACSALKQSYRDRLRLDGRVRFVFLKGDYGLIDGRLRQRRGHYMKAGLLPSQFAGLEEPEGEDVWTVPVDQPPAAVAAAILVRLRRKT